MRVGQEANKTKLITRIKELELEVMNNQNKSDNIQNQNQALLKSVIILQTLLTQAEMHCIVFGEMANKNKDVHVCQKCQGLGYINDVKVINKVIESNKKLNKEEIHEAVSDCQCKECNSTGFVVNPGTTLH